jgi:hypothetical protein
MTQPLRILVSLAYLALSTCLVFLFSFLVPSLGHLQDFELPLIGWIDLDLLAPWAMVASAMLIALLFLAESNLGLGKAMRILEPRAFLYFGALWAERTFLILQGIGNPWILLLLATSLLWIGLFLGATQVLAVEVGSSGENPSEIWREGLGIQFFWVAVFFSFAVQVVIKGYGQIGGSQALVFLGLSYLEFRKLREAGLIHDKVERVLLWVYRSALIAFPLALLIKY